MFDSHLIQGAVCEISEKAVLSPTVMGIVCSLTVQVCIKASIANSLSEQMPLT